MEKKNNMNLALAVIICLALIVVLVFISKNSNQQENMPPSNNNVGMNNANPGNSVSDNSASPSDVAKVGDTVSMNYTGRLQDGTVFDSNVDPKFNHVQPFVFTIGAGQVIPGWDKGIVGMKVGEKKTLVIPPADAYGASGIPGVIPPNSTLTFDVELIGINK